MADLDSINSTPVIDQKKEEENNASSLSKPTESSSAAPKRPRLNYLRSAWTTTDLYYHTSTFSQSSLKSFQSSSSAEDDDAEPVENVYQIKLPPLQLQDYDDEEEELDEVLTEIFRMITIANIICVLSSIVNTTLVLYSAPSWHLFLEHHDWMPHVILPCYTIWWLFMMRVLRNRTTEHLRQYLNWTQLGAALMTITNFFIPIKHPIFQRYHYLFVSSSLLCCFIYAFAKRLFIANDLKHDRLRKRIAEQHAKLQQVIDGHTIEFSNHRLAFLTTVSQEIQDVALMVITTLEQFSPASILSNAHELLSACSTAVPIASISAINTTIRQVCHVSSHLDLLSKLITQAWTKSSSNNNNNNSSSNSSNNNLPKLILAEFDIGELLQNLGDALAGLAAKLDVSLVIYHCDNSLHHTLVLGDEGAIRHALLNHIRNILECCTPGASIEVGLNVANAKRDPKKLNVTFYITHTTSPAIRNANVALLPNANLTAQLLSYINASCTVDTESTNDNQTKFEFTFELSTGKKDLSNKMFLHRDGAHYLLKNHYANIKFSNEPSLKDLNKFIEKLKGLKMVLHAPEHSIFAKHMTSCLTSWNTDISHVPVTRASDASSVCSTSTGGETPDHHSNVSTPNIDSGSVHPPTPRQPSTPPVPTPAIEEEHIHSIPPAFILIDDDITTLENKLNEFRSQPPTSASTLQQAHQGRRNHHYKKSSTSSQNFFHQGTTAIIHFTSLTNYKAVRDTIQCFAVLPSRDPFSMPRVVVVPKPAGPRRFLTALHTAWNNAVVEPQFSAIATSPSSPMPPIISMFVQREIAAATAAAAAASASSSPSDHHRVSPNEHPGTSPGGGSTGGGRSRRPVSGIFSPPPNVDNYFTSQQIITSPTRRRSATGAMGEVDYLTAKTPPAGLMNATSGSVDLGASASAAAMTPPLPPMIPLHDPTTSATVAAAAAAAAVSAGTAGGATVVPLIDVQQPSTENISPDTDDKSNEEEKEATTEPVFKKKVGRTMSNFKLHKKKKKDRGTPFADVVSPPINVLIVEDNIINQAILSAWMKKHKIKFSVASNGLEAVNKWKTGGFHLILMDIQLPVMNGIEATKMIRSIEKEQKIGVLPMSSSFLRQQQEVASATAEMIMNNEEIENKMAAEMLLMNAAAATTTEPQDTTTTTNNAPSIFRSPVIIVALTASSLESDRHAALAAGCNDFLTKPVSLEWLEKKIIEWGCMQALIDFEGWRRWKKNSSSDNNTVVKKKLASLTAMGTNNNSPISNSKATAAELLTAEQIEAEKKRIEELSKTMSKNGILLPGVGNLIKSRRFSTLPQQQQQQQTQKKKLGVDNRFVLKPSKSESDTPTLSRVAQQSTSDTTAAHSSSSHGAVVDLTAPPLLTSKSRSTSREKKFDTKTQKDKLPHNLDSRS